MHTTTYITDKYLLHSTGNYIQHLVIITYNRKNLKSYIYIYIYIYNISPTHFAMFKGLTQHFHLTIAQLQKVK